MSGHSKWSTIKHKKAATDARRGKLFTKILREIMAAARLGGGDPKGNPRLRTALQDARSSSVPNDNIERAIKKGTGELEGEAYEELVYEGYGPGGIAVLIEAMTDNRNRTAQEIRFLFGKHGGNLGESGSVAWMFDRRGHFVVERGALNEDQITELALEIGADDVAIEEEVFEIFTSVEDFVTVEEELEKRKLPVLSKQVAMLAKTPVEMPEGKTHQVLRLMDALEDHEDVQNVWANFRVDDKVMAEAAP
jgi:YebC/PmpR family DNA-binding regulatory protein